MDAKQRDYQSYLLRLWRTGGRQASGWRASLEDISSGELHGFARLDDLFEFLKHQTRFVSGSEPDLEQ